MSHFSLFARRLAAAGAVVFLAGFAGCGGGGSADVVVVAAPPPVTALGIDVRQIGPETVQVFWGDDPSVDIFTVSRDGSVLANVTTTSLIDNSVLFGRTYCYLVTGYDRAGNLIAATDRGCIAIPP